NALELSTDITAGGPGQKHGEIRNALPHQLERRDERVGALDLLGLESFPPADAVLLERADDESRLRQCELATRVGASLRIDERKVLDVDADRDPKDLGTIDAGLQHELFHLAVRDLNAVDARSMLAQGCVRLVEFGATRGPGSTVEIGQAEPMRRVE